MAQFYYLKAATGLNELPILLGRSSILNFESIAEQFFREIHLAAF
ncbi:MAG: hypothetical protein SW833_03040 [Cyanobacteriota bacterium]|nr:hypothetical protein [Cyanobacteriota bacterium]